MKHLQTFEKYYVDGNTVYHYTSSENAMSIIYQGKLNYRRYSIQNKYLSGTAANDYGYISFTENDEYHEETSSEIPTEVRFIFNLDELEKDYTIFKHDANQDEVEDTNVLDDLDKQNIPYYGEEMELRIYDNDIPIKKYLKEINFSYEIEDKEELISICDQNNIIYKEEQY